MGHSQEQYMAKLNSFPALAVLFFVQVARTLSSEVCRLAAHSCAVPTFWRSEHVKQLAEWERSTGGATKR